MKDLNRRDFGVALAALAALGNARGEAQVLGEGTLSKSEVFAYGKLPMKAGANGMESRAVVHGTLPTGEFIEVHETVLGPGQMPHPAHRHKHTELMLIRSGTLEFQNDGVPESLGPGDVALAASGILHGLKNVGTAPAMYFVVAISQQTAEA